MIEEITGLPEGTLGFHFSGQIKDEDYERVLVPTIDKAVERHERIKAHIHFGPDFEGYTLGAAWDDTKLGLRHWSGFERMAVVTDVRWIRTCVQALGIAMPCPIQLFPNDQLDDARRWLGESLGTIHLEQDGNVITVRLIGKLDPSAYEGVDDELSNLMSHCDHVRLMLDLREFDGWSGLAALGDHLSLIREHRRAPERVAVVGDKSWQHLAERIISKFINAQTKYFDATQNDSAVTWLSS